MKEKEFVKIGSKILENELFFGYGLIRMYLVNGVGKERKDYGIMFYKGKEPHEIGEININDADPQNEEQIALMSFAKLESIDQLIHSLEDLKDLIKERDEKEKLKELSKNKESEIED